MWVSPRPLQERHARTARQARRASVRLPRMDFYNFFEHLLDRVRCQSARDFNGEHQEWQGTAHSCTPCGRRRRAPSHGRPSRCRAGRRCCGSARCGSRCRSPCRSACTAPPWPASPGRMRLGAADKATGKAGIQLDQHHCGHACSWSLGANVKTCSHTH